MALTRFYDRQSGRDGPVSGAFVIIPCQFTEVGTNTYAHQTKLPAGMKLRLIAADCYAVAVTSDPSLTIGLTAAATDIVAAVNVTTALGALTLKAYDVTSGDRLDVRITADSDDGGEGISVTLYGYVSAPPTSELRRS